MIEAYLAFVSEAPLESPEKDEPLGLACCISKRKTTKVTSKQQSPAMPDDQHA